MKNKIILHSLSFLLLFSCTTRIVSEDKPYIDNEIFSGKIYSFMTKDSKKDHLKFIKEDEEAIYGENKEGVEIRIEKKQIISIKKSNIIGTVAIITGALVTAILLPAYIGNKPVGQ